MKLNVLLEKYLYKYLFGVFTVADNANTKTNHK